MEANQLILYVKNNSIAILTFNRPVSLNALNTEVNKKLVELLDEAEADSEIRVVILTGSGEKAFIAGADIKEMQNLNSIGAREFALNAKRAADKIYNLKKPVIAAINGFCLGGGLEYALACDIRLASENAKFALPEITLGIMPGSAGTQRLSRLIGVGKAKELIYTGAMISAQEALELGVINHVYKKETLMDEAKSIAEKIAGKSSVALSLIKSSINKGTEIDLETASMFEIDCFALCFATEEQKILMKAFATKK